jgi:hypothetical protein
MKAILTTGFFALRSVLVDLYDAGYEILSAHYAPESIDMECAARFVPDEIVPDIEVKATVKTEEVQKTIGADYTNLPTIGGRRILLDQFMSDLFFYHIDSWSIFAREEAIRHFDKEYDIVGSLVHMESGKSCGVIADFAKEKGIPHFCIHNGITGEGTMRYSALPFYGNKLHTHHYIPGKWTENFINRRYAGVDYTITGHNNFDRFYGHNEKREKNLFVYLPSVVYARKTLATLHKDIVVNDSMYAWGKKTVSLRNDIEFFKAFGMYQREVNPDARVFVPFRQYISSWEGNTEGLFKLASICGVHDLRTVPFGEVPLWRLFLRCEGLITYYSTAVVEGVICRTPTLLLLGDQHLFNAYGGMGSYLECVSDKNKIFEQLVALTDEKTKEGLIENCNIMASHYNYDDDGKATERVVEDMLRRIK